jgi:hypothetical protein
LNQFLIADVIITYDNMIFVENVNEKWTMSSNFDYIHLWMIT